MSKQNLRLSKILSFILPRYKHLSVKTISENRDKGEWKIGCFFFLIMFLIVLETSWQKLILNFFNLGIGISTLHTSRNSNFEQRHVVFQPLFHFARRIPELYCDNFLCCFVAIFISENLIIRVTFKFLNIFLHSTKSLMIKKLV